MASSTSTNSFMTPLLTPSSSGTQSTINQQTTPAVEQIGTDHYTPQMKDFNIPREYRQQLRGLLINSQSLASDETARQRRSSGSSLSDDERKIYHADIDQAVRWNTFLTQTDLNLPEVVDFVSHVHNVNKEEHQCALAKAIKSHKSFKKSIFNNILDHAYALSTADRSLYELDNAALAQKVSDSFSPDKFFTAFAFMADYLDFEGSSSLGKWYAKGIYINMTCSLVRWLCYWNEPDGRDKVLGTFEKMALLEIHDTVDITDFSRLTHVYRLKKEERKQEWAKIESNFVSAGPRPEKEGLAVISGVKVAAHSAYSENDEARGGEGDDEGAHGSYPKSQQSSSSALGCVHPLLVEQSVADESDFSFRNQEFHSGGDAETPQAVDPAEEQKVNSNDGSFGDAAMAGSDEVKKVKKVKVWDFEDFMSAPAKEEELAMKTQEEQVVAGDYGGLGRDVGDWMIGLEKAAGARVKVEEEQVIDWDDGGSGHSSTIKNVASGKTNVVERELEQSRDDGGFGTELDARVAKIENELREMGEMEAPKANKAKESKKAKKAAKQAAKQATEQAKKAKKVKGVKEV